MIDVEKYQVGDVIETPESDNRWKMEILEKTHDKIKLIILERGKDIHRKQAVGDVYWLYYGNVRDDLVLVEDGLDRILRKL